MNAPLPQPPAVRTTCPYCGVGCGLIVQPDGRGGAAVAGDPTHPANFGRTCSKGAALGETLGLDGRLLHPMLRQADGTLARIAWDDAIDRVASGFPGDHRAAWTRRGRVLSLRAVAHRGLLRRQQADEGLPRLGQRRHQFAAVHGVVGRRPPPCVRRRHRARYLCRSRRGRPHRAGRLERRLVSPGAVPAHGQEQGRARRTHRRDRSAPHGDGATRPTCSCRSHPESIRRCSAACSCDLAERGALDRLHRRAHDRVRDALARAAIAPDIAATAGATGIGDGRARVLRSVPQHAPRRHLLLAGRRTSRRRAPTRSTRSSIAISPPAASAGPAWAVLAHRPAQRHGRARGRRTRQPARRAYGVFAAPRSIACAASGMRRAWPTREGLKAVQMFEAIARGEIKALWVMATNPAVSLPRAGARARGARQARSLRRLRERTLERHRECGRACASARPPPGARRTAPSPIRSAASRASARSCRCRAKPSQTGGSSRRWLAHGLRRRVRLSLTRRRLSRARRAVGVRERRHARLRYRRPRRRCLDADYDALEPVQWPVPAGIDDAAGDATSASSPTGGFFTADRKARFIAPEPPALKEATSSDFPLRLNTGRIRDQWHTMTRTGHEPAAGDAPAGTVRRGASG